MGSILYIFEIYAGNYFQRNIQTTLFIKWDSSFHRLGNKEMFNCFYTLKVNDFRLD